MSCQCQPWDMLAVKLGNYEAHTPMQFKDDVATAGGAVVGGGAAGAGVCAPTHRASIKNETEVERLFILAMGSMRVTKGLLLLNRGVVDGTIWSIRQVRKTEDRSCES